MIRGSKQNQGNTLLDYPLHKKLSDHITSSSAYLVDGSNLVIIVGRVPAENGEQFLSISRHRSSPENTMPSLSIAAALLILGNFEGLPWTSSTWQDITLVGGVPWFTEPGADADAQAPYVNTWTTRTAESVKTYARNLWSASDTADQIRYSNNNLSDNDHAGRTAWNKWFQEGWGKTWDMNHRIDKVFSEHKCSPYDVMARAKKRVVSCFSVVQGLYSLSTHSFHVSRIPRSSMWLPRRSHMLFSAILHMKTMSIFWFRKSRTLSTLS